MASSQAAAHRPKRDSASRPKSRDAGRGTSSISALHVLLFLLAFRIVNALALRTFFVPDEYYQSLEPAWQLAFGPRSGAWLTWEWRHQLRSSLHPILFAGVYQIAAWLSRYLTVEPTTESAILLAAPKVVQALFAAGLDFFTWRLAQKVFGSTSRAAWTILAVSTLSPWQWFCSTRTLSNSLEASLTAAALYYWPWGWMLPLRSDELKSQNQQRRPEAPVALSHAVDDPSRPSVSLLLAAIAAVLRPTNVLVWIPIAIQTLSVISNRQRVALVTRAVCCGVIVTLFSVGSDYWFYGFLTFPQWRFLTFNIYQDLAVFYGVHRLDYYLTEGLPLMLMGLLPFALFGLYRSATIAFQKRSITSYSLETIVLPALTWTIITVIAFMSQISHKEARFIYPLLPCLHLIAGPAVSTFTRRASIWKGFIITVILGLHVYIAYYTSRFHQKGVIDVIDWLRLQHERSPSAVATTAAFLMPCHSTPWRSHLIHPNIDAWALTCEPPVNMVPDDRNEYVDEADVFYNNVREWLSTNMELFASLEKSSIQDQISKHANHKERTINGQITGTNRPWPQYIVVFEQLIPQMWMALPRTENRPYELCQRFANTQWHDDWRRQGMVAVFCLMERDEDGRRVSPSIHYV